MANEDSVTGKQFVLEDMHAEANFVSVLAGDVELPVVIHQPANTPPQRQSNGNTLEVSFPQLTNDDGEVFMTDTQKVMVNFVDAVAASRGVQVKLKKD